MHKIMLSYPLYGEGMEILEQKTDLFVSNSGDIGPYVKQLQSVDAFITRNVFVDTDLMRRCPNLKVIGLPGVGYQSWDLKTMTEMGIAMVYCPGTNLRSVAEHAVAMAMTIAKTIPYQNEQVKKGNYAVRNTFSSMELDGHHVGIVGFGNIGRETARLFAALDMQVYVYDPYVKKEDAEALGYCYMADLDALLAVCDVVSLHMPSLPETRGMLNKERFAIMKEGAYIVNCARGDVIDETALYDALVSGRVAGAALDVMVKEPFDLENPLVSLPNVVLTPHVAAVTKEAANRTYKMVVTSTLALLDGERVDNVANPDVFNHPRWKK